MPKYTIRSHTLRQRGRQLIIELWPNENAGALLFYPGTMSSPFQYRPLLSALHQAGLTVAALHLTSHGLNPHTSSFSFDDLLHDGLDAEQWLSNAGFTSPAVCGHSQGGILALAHAAASHKLTAVFPISGVLPQQAKAVSLTLFRAFAGRRERLMNVINRMARFLPWLPIPVAAYLSLRRISAGAQCASIDFSKIRWSYPLTFLAGLFNATLSPHLRCPLYFFNARNDALFTPELINETFNLLDAPHKTMIWLPDGGHLAAMCPSLCRYMACIIATACASLQLPLRLTRRGAEDGL
ncbi:conserved hypothetical protein [Candidatus Desulfovibrio trichonymphae]|uniref:AB hydrolase-1 domain-containing protein n=2 Tax=Candidatus Desulfovibrio trichonymphae TaxID=1725232 RepID=A0A1J1DPP7_9BACT|nr:conserved hypothetical protein [Candidatus Desulfovibrio trichonymphae]